MEAILRIALCLITLFTTRIFGSIFGNVFLVARLFHHRQHLMQLLFHSSFDEVVILLITIFFVLLILFGGVFELIWFLLGMKSPAFRGTMVSMSMLRAVLLRCLASVIFRSVLLLFALLAWNLFG